jgi:alpha-amylase/alpha-mannosidase (GH57 family)
LALSTSPCHRTADGVALAPWAAIHAGGSYTTLTAAIEQAGGRGQVVNIVPTLLEQLEAYHEGRVTDPVIDALVRPPGEPSATRSGSRSWRGPRT